MDGLSMMVQVIILIGIVKGQRKSIIKPMGIFIRVPTNQIPIDCNES